MAATDHNHIKLFWEIHGQCLSPVIANDKAGDYTQDQSLCDPALNKGVLKSLRGRSIIGALLPEQMSTSVRNVAHGRHRARNSNVRHQVFSLCSLTVITAIDVS